MITNEIGMMGTSFLMGGFALGHSESYLSMFFSIIPLMYGYKLFKDIKYKLAEKNFK